MRYLGMDVHVAATVWCLLDDQGVVVERGKCETTAAGLTRLVARLSQDEALLAAQEVGTVSGFVHDVVTEAGTKLLSFNAHHLRMIASSRKKTDKRDAYWIAKSIQTGMMPHPVYIPTGDVRRLRQLISRRQATVADRKRWLLRARSCLHAAGYKIPKTARTVERQIAWLNEHPDGVDVTLITDLEMCARLEKVLSAELKQLEATLRAEGKKIDAVRRLKTIPSVGDWVALTIYASVGDVSRFPNARQLASYAGIVPSVWQSGASTRHGGITKQGSPELRRVLVQAGHVLLWRCKSEEAAPLKAIASRTLTSRGRRKIAVVAAGRHILRLAYYILRDGTVYDPSRLKPAPQALELEEEPTAAQ